MSPVELVDSWGRRFCRGRWGNTQRCRSAGTHATCIRSVFLFLSFLIIYSYFKWVNHLVLRRPQEAGLHPRVAPQPLHNHPQLVRELPVLSWSWCHREELSRIVLRENMSISKTTSFVHPIQGCECVSVKTQDDASFHPRLWGCKSYESQSYVWHHLPPLPLSMQIISKQLLANISTIWMSCSVLKMF